MIDYKHLSSLLDYLGRSVSAFHATAAAVSFLDSAGFLPLKEGDSWNLEPNGAYYLTRNSSCLIAFVVGSADPAEAGFRLLGAHTDSPGLRLRPDAETISRNVLRVGVDIYGSPIVSGWLDRELAVAGRLAVSGASGAIETILVDSVRPVAMVPNAALHLNRQVNSGYEYDPQTKLSAIVSAFPEDSAVPSGSAGAGFLSFAASLASAEPGAVLGSDLYLYDPTPPRRFGLNGELVASGRVDNLAGCHAALTALRESRAAAPARPETRLIALFDNEEVGSRSYQGADSSFLRQVLERIIARRSASGSADAYYRAAAKSFLVSIDATHAFHPSWAEKFDEKTTPLANRGPAVKINGKMKYSTDAETQAVFVSLCSRLGIPVQRFEFRADQIPGATIGPMTSAALGVRTVDVGLPIFAMHSIRESFGAADQDYMVAALVGVLSCR